jgi:hypothetical protein
MGREEIASSELVKVMAGKEMKGRRAAVAIA